MHVTTSTPRRKGGFTLAELLIVVAIIAVLVAIAIPSFTGSLEKSRQSTDAANLRAAYAEVMNQYLYDGTQTTITVEALHTDTSSARLGSDARVGSQYWSSDLFTATQWSVSMSDGNVVIE